MSTFSLFVQEQGHAGIREVIVAEGITAHDLNQALAAGGVQLAADAFVFLNEVEVPLDREGREPVGGLHHGHRVHVSRCRQIRVTVNYLDRQAHREFSAARRVRAVKEWAVKVGSTIKMRRSMCCKCMERPSDRRAIHRSIPCFGMIAAI